MKTNLTVWVVCALGVGWSAQAQWITQTLQLKAGWNAVYLHVDAAYATLDQLVGVSAPVLTPLEQIWRWNPNPATHQFEVYNHYFGPFAVTASASGRAEFGDSLSAYSFRLRNQTAAPLTVTLRLVASETPPSGQTPVGGVPPLLVRGLLDPSDLTYGYSTLPVSGTHAWALAPRDEPGAEVEVVLGLDRAAMTVAEGALLAGVLQLTDSLGHTRVDLAVSATAGSKAGLWVGGAAVTEVAQYLKSYLRDANHQLVIQEDGRYVVTEVVTNLTPVPAPFPLRLIVHNPASGPAILLQRVYYGFNAATNPIVANQESALARNLLGEARRLSAAHLPWSAANAGWNLSGGLGPGAVLTTTITTEFNDHASNPFLHTYHPDHDNLDSTFKAEVPQGVESYTVIREITLAVQPPADHFESRIAAGETLTGDYLETVRVVGLARAGNTFDTRRFDARGVFQISRFTQVPTLTRVP